jgi:hypothetical protein
MMPTIIGSTTVKVNSGRQRMIAHDHAAGAMRGLFLAREMRRRSLPPIAAHIHPRFFSLGRM